MKKPTLQIQEQQPRNIQRADIAPTTGFALVVDGHFKTQFQSDAAAQKAAKELLANYPMLQIEIFDASTKSRPLFNREVPPCEIILLWLQARFSKRNRNEKEKSSPRCMDQS